MPKRSIQKMMLLEMLIKKKKTDYFNKILNMLPIHKELSKLESDKTQMNYVATALYPSAMWDEKSNYPKIETGFAFKPYKDDIYVEAINKKLLTRMVMNLLY